MIEHVVPKHRCGVEIIFARLFVLLYLLAHKIMKFGYKMGRGVERKHTALAVLGKNH